MPSRCPTALIPALALLAWNLTLSAAAQPVHFYARPYRVSEGDSARDASGLGHDGTLAGENGNVPTRVPGQAGFGGALRFVNNGIDHAYGNIPASRLLKIGLTVADTWTVALWANEASDGTGNYVAIYGRFIVQDGGLGIEWDSGAPADPQVYVWHNSLAAWRQSFGPFDNVPGLLDRWVHWAVVYDGWKLIPYRAGNQSPLAWKQAIAHGSTEATDAWAEVPYACADAGNPIYRGANDPLYCFQENHTPCGRGDGVGFLRTTGLRGLWRRR